MKKVLVAGASGYLGGYLLQEAKKQGYWVRALTRDITKIKEQSIFIDNLFLGVVTNPETLQGICKDIEVVISSIGITHQKDGLTFMDVDYQGNMNLLQEAQKEGIAKFIFVSVFDAEKMQNLKVIRAKQRFEKALKQSAVDYTIIYPNGFFSDMQEYLKMADKGRAYLFGDGQYRINPIHGADLAKVCVNAIIYDKKEINVGGPDILSHKDIINLASTSVKKTVKISKVPVWLTHMFVKLLRIFTPEKVYGPVEFFSTVCTRDLIAPAYGRHHLKDFFLHNKNRV